MNPKSHLTEPAPLDNNNKRSSSLKKWAIAVIILAFVGVFILPFLITHCSWFYNLGTSKPNEIGDTIGGILSPFIGLVSAILIYITIDQQIEANRKIQTQIDNERTDKFEETIFLETTRKLDILKAKIENFDITNSENLKEDPSNYFGTMLDSKIFNEPEIVKSIKTSEAYIPEKFANEFINFFEEFIHAISFFNSNVNSQKAYLSIIYNRFQELSKYFSSDGILRIRTKFQFQKTPNLYLHKLDSYYLITVKFLLEEELYLNSKLGFSKSFQDRLLDSIAFSNELMNDREAFSDFESKRTRRDIYELSDSDTDKPKTPDEFKNLDENYGAFIKKLKKKGIYVL